MSSKLPELNHAISPHVASQTPSPVPSAPATSFSNTYKEQTPDTDSFRHAVNKATSAANMAQSAKSRAEWDTVASFWQEAIEFMKAVPPSSPNYKVARDRVVQYQRNLDYARSAANRQ
ncbi:MAG: hypothetical protein MUC60_01250 [Oscillatoria sp. Prado101]|nr:hypothetical protein [Oscillatoria sp. Prado101]